MLTAEEVARRGGGPEMSRPSIDRVFWAAVVVAVAPIVVAAVRAVVDGWLPLGDNAYFTVRSRDVFGSAHPSVGAWSSGSAAVGSSVNNLGPLQLDLLAPFTKVGPAAGTAIGVAAVNVASVVGIGLAVRRVASVTAVIVALAATSLVAWSMGSELLVEPRQHHALMLPFLCYLVLCWATASGDRWLLPWAAFAASLLAQTHLTYLIIVPTLALWTVAALVVGARSGASDPTVEGGAWWRPLRRPVAATIGVLAVCWAQTLVDQFWGTGNLGRLAGATDSGGTAPGLGAGIRIVAGVIAWPPAWLRSGFREFRPGTEDNMAVAVIALAAVLGALAAFAIVARRRRDRPAVTAAATATVALVSAVVSASWIPAGVLGAVEGNYRWLWPLTGFVAFALVTAGLGSIRRPAPAGRPRSGVVGVIGAGLLLVLSVANVPAAYQVELLRSEVPRRPVVRELLRQLDGADITGPVVFDRSGTSFGEPYAYAVLVELQEEGVEFTFDTDADVSRFGEAREDGGRARQRLVLATGTGAREARVGSERIAFASSLTEDMLRERERLLARVADDVAAGRIGLTGGGRQAAAADAYPAYRAVREGRTAAAADVRGDVRAMLAGDLIVADDDVLARVRRMDQLEEREQYETVALYLQPAT